MHHQYRSLEDEGEEQDELFAFLQYFWHLKKKISKKNISKIVYTAQQKERTTRSFCDVNFSETTPLRTYNQTHKNFFQANKKKFGLKFIPTSF